MPCKHLYKSLIIVILLAGLAESRKGSKAAGGSTTGSNKTCAELKAMYQNFTLHDNATISYLPLRCIGSSLTSLYVLLIYLPGIILVALSCRYLPTLFHKIEYRQMKAAIV